MQFKEVFINGSQRFVFAFTKREAEVLLKATRNAQAPIDERIIHFDTQRGMMWATDRHQLVSVEAFSDYTPRPEWPVGEFAVTADEFKALVTKSKTNELIVVDATGQVGLLNKCDIHDGTTITTRHLGELELVVEYDYTAAALDEVLSRLRHDASAGAASFYMSTRFGHTLAALAKATGDGDAFIFAAPVESTAPMEWQVADEMDGALWRLVVMPLAPVTPTRL